MKNDIVHFNVRSSYSIGESTNQIWPLVLRARRMGMKALGLADIGILGGTYEFQRECQSRDKAFYGNLPPLKPIIGLTTAVSFKGSDHTVRLFAKNEEGYGNLVRLSSECAMMKAPRIRAIPIASLSRRRGGLVCFVGGCCAALVGHLLRLFGEDLVLEAVDDDCDFSAWPSATVCAAPPVLFTGKGDAEAYGIWTSVLHGHGKALECRTPYSGTEYLLSAKEMARLFPKHPEWVAATSAISDRFGTYSLDKPVGLPRIQLPSRFKTPHDYLRHLVFAGAGKRWGRPLPDNVAERLENELDVIRNPGPNFPPETVATRFLVVRDCVMAARRMGMAAMAGRGATSGCAVAYALDISPVDPFAHGLLFDRFFNRGRTSPPLLDVDFGLAKGYDGFDRIFAYLRCKYGDSAVAREGLYAKFSPASLVHGVARALGLPEEASRNLSYSIPTRFSSRLEDLIRESDELQRIHDWDGGAEGKALRIAVKLADCVSGFNQSACRIALCKDGFGVSIPTVADDKSGVVLTQSDQHHSGSAGMSCFNLLSHRALSEQIRCATLVRKAGGPVIDLGSIPVDDSAAFAVFAKGNTKDIMFFQSDTLRMWLRKLKPASLADIAVIFALFRPGPMDSIPEFIARRKRRGKVDFAHPLMEKALAETFGLNVWQEQIMEMSQTLAGFSPIESDELRLALGRKDAGALDGFHKKFEEGCLSNPEFRIGKWKDEKHARWTLGKIWRCWLINATFVFNKSHAYAYSHIAYTSAYLKAHFPKEFVMSLSTPFS